MSEDMRIGGVAAKALRTGTDLPISVGGLAAKTLRTGTDLPISVGGLAVKVLRDMAEPETATPWFALTSNGRVPLTSRILA